MWVAVTLKGCCNRTFQGQPVPPGGAAGPGPRPGAAEAGTSLLASQSLLSTASSCTRAPGLVPFSLIWKQPGAGHGFPERLHSRPLTFGSPSIPVALKGSPTALPGEHSLGPQHRLQIPLCLLPAE